MSMAADQDGKDGRRDDRKDDRRVEPNDIWRRRLVVLVPLALFLGLSVLFLIRLGAGDVSHIPSALIGKPAPATNLPPVPGIERDGKPVPGLEAADFKGAVTLLNVWASWCVPCVEEAPLLVRIARDPRIRIAGINYKDSPENAKRFLNRYGNPFAANGMDSNGRASIEWGVYGVPETFVVGRDGLIAYKLIGPITAQNADTVLKPEIEKAIAAASKT
jgi:cytochrome c biogenesis protein CcmG, thiol:disulfide interchange protein DsbE